MNSREGDILSVTSGIVVQGCNAQGVMGSGLAKHIRAQYPEVYDVYARAHQSTGLKMGSVVWAPPTETRPFWVANAITQKFYGRNPNVRYVDYDAVRQAFEVVAACALQEGLDVHYPMIGAGLGNGDWVVISGIIDTALAQTQKTLWLLPPAQPKPPKP